MSFDKLYKKYAILPPPPNDEEEVVIPELGKTPVIEDLTEEEMKDWEDFISVKKREKERMKDYLGKEEKLDQDMPTIRPPKKADLSPDTLLKMCSQYHDLCRKF